MLIAFLLSVTLLPALLLILRPPGEPGRSAIAAWRPRSSLIRAPRLVLTSPGARGGIRGLLPLLRFDVNPLNLHNPKSKSVATIMDLMKDRSTSPYTIEVLAPSLAGAQKEAERLAKLPEVAQVITLAKLRAAGPGGPSSPSSRTPPC